MRIAFFSISRLQGVELLVAADHGLRQPHVALGDGGHRVGDLGLHQPAHARHLGLQLRQLFAEEF